MKPTTDASDLAAGAAFVPTMGALHEGHLSLIRAAKKWNVPVVVSIFVNPTQFAPGEDFEAYPRPLERDLQLLEAEGVDFAFVPEVRSIYPSDQTCWSPPLPSVAHEPKLEDAHRPHFFAGVCAVVSRLFDLVQPHHTFFGEKDWQQLQVVRAMVKETGRWPELKVHPVPTMRSASGLALSSRNAYLSSADLHAAESLNRALQHAADGEGAMRAILEDAGCEIDYAVIRDADTLMHPQSNRPRRALVAATVSETRLIDNASVD